MGADVSQLKKAVELIRRGKAEKARPILVEILRAEPANSQAWFLLSFTLDERKQKVYALQQALRAEPQFERARQRLGEMLGGPVPAAAAKQKPQAASTPQATPPLVFQQPEPLAPKASGKLQKNLEPESVLRETTEEPKRSGVGARQILAFLGLIVLFAVVFILSRSWFTGLLSNPAAAATQAEAFRTLPPTWTPLVESEATAQPTEVSSQSVLQLSPLDPAVLGLMSSIRDQVNVQRGLEPTLTVESGLVSPENETKVLEALYDISEGDLGDARDVLLALNLLPANYTLNDYYLNSQADRYGAVYTADLKRIYLFAGEFSGVSTFAYAREYANSLIDQNFTISEIYQNKACLPFSDGCRALKAFVTGDIEKLSLDWLNAFAPAETFQAVQNSAPSAMLVESQPAAHFPLLDLTFLYERGTEFVETVYELDGWEQVDIAYRNPPTTSEQIMHPEKYFSGEAALGVSDNSIGGGLGGGGLGAEWEPALNGNLGEWLTYLLLAQNENITARLAEEQAQTAAAGWGGDLLQAYRRKVDGTMALAEHWLMDSDTEATELAAALQAMFDLQFGPTSTASGNGTCWSGLGKETCLFSTENEVLFLLGPDSAVIQTMLAQFPQFQ